MTASTSATTRRRHLRSVAGVATIVATIVLAAPTAGADGPTCENMFGSGWKNHGEHVVGYVNSDGGAGGGAPAHLATRPGGPAPGASFCLDQAQSPGMHPSDFGG